MPLIHKNLQTSQKFLILLAFRQLQKRCDFPGIPPVFHEIRFPPHANIKKTLPFPHGNNSVRTLFRFQPIQRTIVMACFWVNMRCPFSYPRFASRLFNSPSPLIQRRRRCDALRGLVSGNSFTARSQNLIDFKANPPFLRQNWQTIPRCLSKTGGRSGRKHHRKRAVPHFRPCEPYILFRPVPLSPHIGFRECRK